MLGLLFIFLGRRAIHNGNVVVFHQEYLPKSSWVQLCLQPNLFDSHVLNADVFGVLCTSVFTKVAHDVRRLFDLCRTHGRKADLLITAELREHPKNISLKKVISSWRFLFSLDFWITRLKFIFHIEIFRHTGLFKNFLSICFISS